ncbi:uncharacterized protein LOC117328783 [Pecten maximus]|uniref:uncharacterized protein LOC117328783 n=1 Tax=Pecten maximus TaxID=6579 RepID=UPI001457ED4B|nr:uncharacterized protein LOC117328783 [Pecten maximus]XP_033742214.1 uncharacterized protein LOC117328783 [Pecten maximus]
MLSSHFSLYTKYWLIRKPDVSDTLTFYFAAFRLESCSYDTLKVYQGACVYHTLLYTFCGEIDLDEKYSVSLGMYVLLYMHTDSSVVYPGFDLRYSIGNGNENDDEEETDIPLPAIIIPVIVVVIIVGCFVFRVLTRRKTTAKPTSKVSPPNLSNFKLTTSTKVRVPKQKPVRKKATPPLPDPQPPVLPKPTPLPPPHSFHDPAYPPPPQTSGGSVPPLHNTYKPQIQQMAAEVPNPFVYTPPY